MPTTTQFTIRLLLPIAAVAALTLVALAGFLWWSAEQIDNSELEREKLLLTRALEGEQSEMLLAQQGVAIWDDSIAALERRDIGWLVENLGTYHFDAYDYERVIVVDHALNPIISVVNGYAIPPESARAAISSLDPMFDMLRNPATEAHIAAFGRGGHDTPPHVIAFNRFEDKPALVGIMPILSFSGVNAPAPGTESYLVSVKYLDSDLGAALGDQYRMDMVAFLDATTSTIENRAMLPVTAADGTVVAQLSWKPGTPGASLLRSALPAMMAALAIAMLIVIMLLRGLYLALLQLRIEREEASHNALHDPLTGLGNRALFHLRLLAALRDLPPGGPRVALLALDLDRFKEVNDTLGHAAGDELLRHVSQRLNGTLRPDDTLVRLGGDEFAIIQTGIVNHDQPTRLAQSIISVLSDPVALRDGTASIGVSIGIATAPDAAGTEDDLTRLADDALYRAKGGGRNRYVIHLGQKAGENPAADNGLLEGLANRRSSI
ncbi:diguanylate cyclase [Devosia sp. 63-57]|uniref:sensor domain-containing diguanylate cyclase n=1 Tax=Devosia sp. 63-57 TaxID=1895751 RepID=UPI00086BA38E|nr:diguanylate cyclase [Devosia sp. 63-57]ODT49665.1 MAG: hypothetical protein ABS74_07235 [Pelagibacterium sp. SCN 63-126]ODU87678.1 MAG: hypothetical protein ABT14_04820 [Pelagibacterium sp. SCN 63-17]OJX45679.1 MAG: hypothetical protein BGO80_07805 [Devosia sp. 63-57]